MFEDVFGDDVTLMVHAVASVSEHLGIDESLDMAFEAWEDEFGYPISILQRVVFSTAVRHHIRMKK